MKQPDCCCPLCRQKSQAAAPCKDCKPNPGCGFLLPRIIANGRTWLRHTCCTLQLEGLPDCAQPPFTLVSLAPCSAASWEPQPAAHLHQLRLVVRIPLSCQVRDNCGVCHTAHTCIETELTLAPSCPVAECWRSCMQVFPCVRLVCTACSDNDCFDTQLEVLIEAYLLRWDPCMTGMPAKPKCPDLPLYPQPCTEA